MTLPVDKGSSREITYHVGWKKGKINKSGDKKPNPDASSHANVYPHSLGIRWIWQPVPFLSWLPSRLIVLLLTLLPVAGFATIVWLVSMLAKIKD